MGSLYKTSRSEVRPVTANDRFIYLLESENPEIKLAKKVRDFLETVGYSQLFPNFNNVRVGTIHPFAVLLSQEVLGKEQSVNIFPAITISDTTMQEDVEVLGDEYSAAVWDQEDIITIGGYREAQKVFCSDEGWTRIKNRVSSNGGIVGITKQYHTNHSIDFNIWSDNKEVTSFLFDMIAHFVTQMRSDLHESDGYDMTGIQGRRSGDINLDFGTLLYGSNITVSLGINHRATLFDTGLTDIRGINTQKLPMYFNLGSA